MKIIPPHKVTAQLLDIIHEAEKEIILVSPYVDFTSWQKPVTAIKSAIACGVKVTFYIRSKQDSKGHRLCCLTIRPASSPAWLNEELHTRGPAGKQKLSALAALDYVKQRFGIH